MVGVPGRSKGCNTCIQRKVKCDRGQPTCGNCNKAHRLCPGYKRPVAFVMAPSMALGADATSDNMNVEDATTITTQGRWRKRTRATLKVASELVSDPRKAKAEARAAVGNAEANDTALLDFASPVAHKHAGNLPLVSPYAQHVSTEPAWREQLFPLFLRFHLPHGIMQHCKTSSDSKTLRARNWLLSLSDAPLDNAPALETAMVALCMSRVGRKHGHPALVQHSLRLYTTGLRQLHAAVRDPARQRSDQTLAACAAFAMYEVAECPARKLDGFNAHHRGGLALLQMRGPDAHISPLGHALFVFLRMQQFIYALLTRKASFLSQADWASRPWQSTRKDPQDLFMDQMYQIPVLLEQTDQTAAAASSESDNNDAATTIRAYWRIMGQYHAILDCLRGWHRNLRAVVAGPLYWPELSKMRLPAYDDEDDTDRGRPFSVAFHFPAFSIGQAMLLFWLISAIVNHQLWELYRRVIALRQAGRPLSEVDNIDDNLPSLPAMEAAALEAQTTCRTVSHNICQSVEFFLQDGMGDAGPLLMILPLAALRHVLVHMEPARPCPRGRPGLPGEHADEVVWVDALMQVIGGKGQQLAYYIDDDDG